ncbi:MAG: OmpA family protein [Bacteroidales bacterium]|nr:OmpA family protein [Bacteroidales bacterium]
MKSKLTPLSKFMIVLLILGGIAFLLYKTNVLETIAPKGETTQADVKVSKDKLVRVGVVTWGGYAGGQLFNEGFEASESSRYFKEYGIMVEFKLLDDFNDCRNAWKSDNIDLMWATVDAFTTEVSGLKDFEPQIVFQSDWSRGGDAVVVNRTIKNVADLKGKKVAFAEMTPSHTFLLWLLEAGNLDYTDITPIKVANAIDAADLFKKGQVDAAVVWSPDDADCIAKVNGSKILQSTKEASYIIADVFVAKKNYVDNNKELLKALVEGWMKGAAEINTSAQAKQKAASILSKGLQQPEDFCLQAINNARICTYGDNLNFFNTQGDYKGITGEAIYNKMAIKYAKTGYPTENISSWRLVGNSSIISSINLIGAEHASEASVSFSTASATQKTVEAISTKRVSIAYRTGSSELDENAKYIIDNEFLDIAKSFANARIRIEGNTDNVGSASSNKLLSEKRARAVVEYLVSEHRFDRNRFIVVGNGPDKPIADNDSESGKAKNRRTDFELLPQ